MGNPFHDLADDRFRAEKVIVRKGQSSTMDGYDSGTTTDRLSCSTAR